MFKVFNPLTGVYEDAANETGARELLASIVAATAAHFTFVPVVQGRHRFDPAWASDYDLAWAFLCQKKGQPVTDVLSQDGPAELLPAHSVFNTTTGAHWSNTFAYYSDSGQMFHIKVHDGQITDWYAKHAEVDGQAYEWVAFDLASGDPIEVYELTGVNTLTKRSLIDASLPPVITHFMPLAEMPEHVRAAVGDMPFKETITAYSEKSYGLIVEYSPPHRVPEEEWPSEVKFEQANLREQALFAARNTARELVKVVSVSIEEDGSETWEPHPLTV